MGVRDAAVATAGGIGDLGGEPAMDVFIVAAHQTGVDFLFAERQ